MGARVSIYGGVAMVTGAAGFIGANLVRTLLAEGMSVHACVRATTDMWRLRDVATSVQMHTVDLRDREAVLRATADIRPDVIIHLARHRGHPASIEHRDAYRDNLDATLHVLEAARAQSVGRVIHAGSSLEYDLTRSPQRESDAPMPLTVHGVTKAAATLLCQQFARQYQMPVVVLRFFTVYGPWEDPTRLVPSAMTASLTGRPLRLTRPGLCHDWIHVGEVVRGCLRSLSVPGLDGEVLNLATGRSWSNEAVVDLVEELSGRPIVREVGVFPQRPWDTAHWVADVTKASEMLGWGAEGDLRAGLASTLEWFSEHHARHEGASR